MGRAERVVHVDFRKGSELLREGRVVLLLFLMEADVLQQLDLAVFEGGGDALRAFAHDILRHPDLLPQRL